MLVHPESTERFVVVFEKQHSGFGPTPRGERWQAHLRQGAPEDEAVRRAWRIFQRDRAAENQMAWKVVEVR